MKAVTAAMALLWVGCVTPPKTPSPVEGYVNSLGMKFVRVPGILTQVCVWETRVQDYAEFAATDQGVNSRWQRPGFKQADSHPVTHVSLEDARAFCEWLTERELAARQLRPGQRYRLPTDAEWTAAARPAVFQVAFPAEEVVWKYPWGNEFPPVAAGNYGVKLRVDHFFFGSPPLAGVPTLMLSVNLKGDPFVYTSPVGSFPANPHGIHDLGGNVREWCVVKRTPVRDAWALRGASWRDDNATDLESAHRVNMDAPDGRGTYGVSGFRCVLDLGDTLKPPPPPVFVNSLGMKFLPVKNTEVQFCIWETRVRDYARFAKTEATLDPSWRRHRFGQSGSQPVANVSWNEARKFCAWLTAKELAGGGLQPGQRYRLPTDAEWSQAVGLTREFGASPRAKDLGFEGIYPWGTAWPPPKGAGNFDLSPSGNQFQNTSGVGSFQPNANGLHDLGGNAWEWVEDRWYPGSAFRVLRGAWRGDNPRSSLQSSYRFYDTPDNRGRRYGFRVVLTNAPRR